MESHIELIAYILIIFGLSIFSLTIIFLKDKKIHRLEKELLEFEKNKKEVLTIDAKDLLADLCRGSAVIKITPLDPKYIFEYSPRG